MSCFTCTTPFSWRRKELACDNCKKSFCKDCLVLQKDKNKRLCNKCLNPRTIPNSEVIKPTSHSTKNEIGSHTKKGVGTQINTVPGDPDDRIRERLKLLKDKPAEVPTQNEIEKRLSGLTGREHTSTKASSNILQPQKKLTEAEQVMNLLKETNEIISIDDKVDSQDTTDGQCSSNSSDIEKRLMNLKGIRETDKTENKTNYSSDDEDDDADKLIKKVLAESQLDSKMEESDFDYLVKPKDGMVKLPDIPGATIDNRVYIPQHDVQRGTEVKEDELPWCCICNNDAVVRCQDCDDDLYCKTCFREGHRDFDMKYHKTTKYRPPKQNDDT